MELRMADTFTASLARLNGAEQKAVKMTRNWNGRSITRGTNERSSYTHLSGGSSRVKYNGPARISGSAGTGKTIVVLHRAVALARRHPQARVLLTTFSKALANALRIRLRTLTGNEPEIAARIAVHPVTGIGYDLYAAAFGQPKIAAPALIEK